MTLSEIKYPNLRQTTGRLGFQRLWEVAGSMVLTRVFFPQDDAKRPVDSMMVGFEARMCTSKRPRGCSYSNAKFGSNSGLQSPADSSTTQRKSHRL